MATMKNQTGRAFAMLRRAERERDRIEAQGGPIKTHAASYNMACGVLTNCRRQLDAGLGVIPLLPLLGWALAALIGTATIVGGVAIAQSTSAIARTGQQAIEGAVMIALAFAGLWATAKLAPTLAGSYRQTRRALA